MSEHTVSLLAAVFIILLIVRLVNWYLHRIHFVRAIDAIPGPPAYPFLGTTHLYFGLSSKDAFRKNRTIRHQFPGISRLWAGPFANVIVSRAEYVEKVLSSRLQHMQKSWGYNYVKQWLGEGLLISYGEKWFAHRKIITPTFHFSILEGFCDIFTKKSNIMIEQLAQHCNEGSIHVHPFITSAALDIIGEAAMGVQINAQDQSGENAYVNAVHTASRMIRRRLVRPWLQSDFIYGMTRDGKKFAQALQLLHEYSANVIRQRRAVRINKVVQKHVDDVGRKQRLAFLDLLLETSERDEESWLSDQDIREEVDTFMFEGHDTSTSGITWTLFLLGLHPQVQEAVHEELVGIFGDSKRSATLHDMNEMNYLERVIKETLRLYPPVPIIGRTVSEDLQMGEYVLPKGCMVIIDSFDLHRDERFFVDAERFDPDRFLPENTANRHPYAYVPFSAGNRNCIGQKFAMYEEKSMLSSIVRNFRFTTVGKREDIEPMLEVILRPTTAVMINFEKRK